MPLFSEFALTPDVFDSTCYSSSEAGEVYCKLLKKALIEEGGLVRDLRNQGWSNLLLQTPRTWHPKWKELVKKLKKQNRLISFPSIAASEPGCDEDWCAEAISSNGHARLTGIITNRGVAARFGSTPEVCSVTNLETKDWWLSRSMSLRLKRTLLEYRDALELILRNSPSIMFIDAHLDPSDPAYKEFGLLLQIAGGRTPAPKIEIHRVIYEGSGSTRKLVDPKEWETRFRTSLAPDLRAYGPVVEVFIWDDFHDRHIISKFGGIHLGNGLKTTKDPALTTWSRVDQPTYEDIEREFDSNSGRHYLHHSFKIP